MKTILTLARGLLLSLSMPFATASEQASEEMTRLFNGYVPCRQLIPRLLNQ